MTPCAYCSKPSEGNASIHRDGFGVGPEVDLCDACGLHETPTCEEIWDRIAQPSAEHGAHKPSAPTAQIIDLFDALKRSLAKPTGKSDG
jgi:hypothetical protein